MKKLSIVFFILVFATGMNAQTFGLELGPGFPIGDFGKDDISDDDETGAGIGLALGAHYSFPISDVGLELFGETGIYFNPLKKSYRDDLEEAISEDFDYSHSKYLGIPVIGGLQYVQEPDGGVGFFFKAGGGIGLVKPLRFLVEADGVGEIIQTFDMSTGFALTFAGGIILQDQITIGLKYMGLGDREFDGEQDIDYDDPAIQDDKSKLPDLEVKPSLITVNIGMRF